MAKQGGVRERGMRISTSAGEMGKNRSTKLVIYAIRSDIIKSRVISTRLNFVARSLLLSYSKVEIQYVCKSASRIARKRDNMFSTILAIFKLRHLPCQYLRRPLPCQHLRWPLPFQSRHLSLPFQHRHLPLQFQCRG